MSSFGQDTSAFLRLQQMNIEAKHSSKLAQKEPISRHFAHVSSAAITGGHQATIRDQRVEQALRQIELMAQPSNLPDIRTLPRGARLKMNPQRIAPLVQSRGSGGRRESPLQPLFVEESPARITMTEVKAL